MPQWHRMLLSEGDILRCDGVYFWLPCVNLLTCLNEGHNLPMSVKYQNVKECL